MVAGGTGTAIADRSAGNIAAVHLDKAEVEAVIGDTDASRRSVEAHSPRTGSRSCWFAAPSRLPSPATPPARGP